ncbi:Zn(II)2Cys6 transcription factor domain-containing protein [Aspergillus lucknowensis]|uniref:Zn(2)-C6 fungal-type domain-containing protein n=1 Tax=Aspergillus lucknowensis TaxID=176173 RepID=A0ABR4LZ92_9EURO
MPGVPSNKSCERCKKRHLKCDEARPQCARCVSAGVECPGYVQTHKFIDQGASVRRRYAPYQGSPTRPGEVGSTSRGGVSRSHEPGDAGDSANGRDQAQSQLLEPSRNPPLYLALGSGIAELCYAPSENPLDTTTDALGQEHGSGMSHPGLWRGGIGTDVAPAKGGPSETNNPLARDQSSPPPNPSPQTGGDEFREIFSDLMTGTEHEMSFLVRYYSDHLASWLDISDTGNFFEAYIPVRAIDEECLKYAIAALSSKHIGKMKGVVSETHSGMFTSPAAMETYPNAQQANWSLKAANYYYLAVSHMYAPISDYGSISSSTLFESPIAIVDRWLNLELNRAEPAGKSHDKTCKRIENLLATSTILTLYKILDEPGENWQLYLPGTKPLFSRILALIEDSDGSSAHFSPGITAAFWNYARLDYLASYYNRMPTHLDPEHLALWRAAGLALDDLGNVASQGTMHNNARFCSEDMASNVLTRLLNKVTNFLAASKRAQLERWAGRASESPKARTTNAAARGSRPTTATWLKLCFELESWFESIPEPFHPCLRLARPKSPSSHNGADRPFPEIFYSLPSSASTMQQYHFGRLALSLNRPVDEVSPPSTAFDRLQGYRDLTKEADYRCREICGVALARPRAAARAQMITLLYAVGQCLEKPEERQVVVELLRGIEADLGWSTASQVQKLKK